MEELQEGRIPMRMARPWEPTLPVEELIRQRLARSGNGAAIGDPAHAKLSRNFDLALGI